MAMLLGIALTIFIVEAQIPPIVAIPGIKLGLANIVTLLALYLLGPGEAFLLLILRIVLGSVFAGQAVSLIYSLSGGVLCFAVMALCKGIVGKNQVWALSVLGALAHNTGQVLAAFLLTATAQVLWYLPVLLISGVITGVFTGLCAQLLLIRKQIRRGFMGMGGFSEARMEKRNREKGEKTVS